jgi:hypothetical protein
VLNSILRGIEQSSVSPADFLICALASAVLGAVLALIHSYKNKCTANFLMTIVMLPVIVQAVIMLVNGNLGTGVAVAGAFSLIRFRSMPGNSREILSVFAAMALGLATGMGYIGMGILLVAMVAILTIVMCSFFGKKKPELKELRITIPESLDYYSVFDDIFARYLSSAELVKVKTTNMGSLYELQYTISETDEKNEKAMIDELRVRNGNLNISCGHMRNEMMEL